jgi:pimeloyl-ACP methyl ester carboxylesterase
MPDEIEGGIVQGNIDILGHPTWVRDDEGVGVPLLMLHGGLLGSDASWGELLPLLASSFRLVMFDRRGHGRTADSDDAFHYSAMAEETAAVIEVLDLAPVNVVGYSDGATLLLHLATERPELISAMVLLSCAFRSDAMDPRTFDALEGLAGDDNMAAQAYAAASPDGPTHWPVVLNKTITMASTEPAFEPSDLATIDVPTLVLASDDELWPTSHSVALYDALPNAQLAIVPNTSHMLVFEQPALVASLVTAFLEHPQRAETLFPTNRQPTSSDRQG